MSDPSRTCRLLYAYVVKPFRMRRNMGRWIDDRKNQNVSENVLFYRVAHEGRPIALSTWLQMPRWRKFAAHWNARLVCALRIWIPGSSLRQLLQWKQSWQAWRAVGWAGQEVWIESQSGFDGEYYNELKRSYLSKYKTRLAAEPSPMYFFWLWKNGFQHCELLAENYVTI